MHWADFESTTERRALTRRAVWMERRSRLQSSLLRHWPIILITQVAWSRHSTATQPDTTNGVAKRGRCSNSRRALPRTDIA